MEGQTEKEATGCCQPERRDKKKCKVKRIEGNMLQNGVASCVANPRLQTIEQQCQVKWQNSLISLLNLRPPLSKKLFPVGRVGKKKASREVGNLFSFFSPNFIFYKLEHSGGKVKKKKDFENRKKFQYALFSPPGRWTGNNFLFEDGLMQIMDTVVTQCSKLSVHLAPGVHNLAATAHTFWYLCTQ